MLNDRLAVRLLHLVTTPDRAAAIAGDLLEEASTRGRLWFWSSVLQTSVFHLFQDLVQHKGRMLWLVFSGFVESFVFVLIYVTIMNQIISAWATHWPYQIGPNAYYIPPWAFHCFLTGLVTLIPFVVGLDVARRSKGHELTAVMAWTGLSGVLSVPGFVLNGIQARHYESPLPYTQYPLLDQCAWIFFFIAGALMWRLVSSRRRDLAPAES